MGNCSPKGITQSQKTPDDTIRVVTDSGTVLYLQGPKLVQEVVEDFPGYGVFGQGRGASSRPLPHDESLATSQFYHLLPLQTYGDSTAGALEMAGFAGPAVEPERASPPGLAESLASGAGLEVLPMPRRGDGVWKVKLVIDTKQLEEIMSQEVNVEALIERMREAASSTSSGNYTGAAAATQSPKRGKAKGGLGLRPSLSNIFRASSC